MCIFHVFALCSPSYGLFCFTPMQKEMIQQHRQEVQQLRGSLPRPLGGAPVSVWADPSMCYFFSLVLFHPSPSFIQPRTFFSIPPILPSSFCSNSFYSLPERQHIQNDASAFVQWSPRLPPSRQSSYSHQLPRIKETRLHTPFKYPELLFIIFFVVVVWLKQFLLSIFRGLSCGIHAYFVLFLQTFRASHSRRRGV